MSTRLIPCSRLNSADFVEFGDVISAREAEVRGLRSVEANQGTARKVLDVTTICNLYEGQCESGKEAKIVVNMFVCSPRELECDDRTSIFNVRVLERHRFTAQMFVPVGLSSDDTTVRYLVIVAPTLPTSDSTSSSTASPSIASTRPASTSSDVLRKGQGPPDLDNLKAFIATGEQAVTYAAGTWHAPMCVLGERPINFVVVQYSNGVDSEDCQEFHMDAGEEVRVDVGRMEGLKSKL